MIYDLFIGAMFAVIVGVASTATLDGWIEITFRIMGGPKTDWGRVGRWLNGLRHGRLVLDRQDDTPATRAERVLGWAFHYLVGVAYAAALPLGWGTDYLMTPRVWPAVLIGLIVSTAAGLAILMPALGGGFLAARSPQRATVIARTVAAHTVFAAALYLSASAYALAA